MRWWRGCRPVGSGSCPRCTTRTTATAGCGRRWRVRSGRWAALGLTEAATPSARIGAGEAALTALSERAAEAAARAGPGTPAGRGADRDPVPREPAPGGRPRRHPRVRGQAPGRPATGGWCGRARCPTGWPASGRSTRRSTPTPSEPPAAAEQTTGDQRSASHARRADTLRDLILGNHTRPSTPTSARSAAPTPPSAHGDYTGSRTRYADMRERIRGRPAHRHRRPPAPTRCATSSSGW